jgi:hypothetical protein
MAPLSLDSSAPLERMVYNPFELVHLSTHDSSRADGSSCWSDQMLHAMARGLVTPSTPISNAAIMKLQQQAFACSQAASRKVDHSIVAAAAPGFFSWSKAAWKVAAADGQLVKSLPTELLYDTEGLHLFDKITYVPEYYLTAAEADILAAHGPDIVESCGIRDGSMLLELGAG